MGSYLIHKAPSNERVCQLSNVPVANHGLVPVAVAPAAQICGVWCEFRVKALKESVRPASMTTEISMLPFTSAVHPERSRYPTDAHARHKLRLCIDCL